MKDQNIRVTCNKIALIHYKKKLDFHIEDNFEKIRTIEAEGPQKRKRELFKYDRFPAF